MAKNSLCWLFGHKTNTDADYYDGECFWWVCRRCGESLDSSDVYESRFNSRWQRVKEFFGYWFYRRWWPEKCHYCGKRFKCNDKVDHIPF